MGGAAAAVPQPASVFYNPAGLAAIRHFTLMHNHSARHFPGSREGGMSEWDQLDGDTQAIVVPLPLTTYSHGFTASGEMGYDYRGHPADGSLSYPRENYHGSEDYDALATSLGLPCALGIAYRRHYSKLTPAPDDTTTPPWFREGEGTQWGVLARVWPGLDYGYSELDMDYDWTLLLQDDNKAGRGFSEFSSNQKTCRSGWALRPAGWLILANDELKQNYSFMDSAGLGLLHLGDSESVSEHQGGELCLGALIKLRWGSYDGNPTIGIAINFGSIWLNYAEVKYLLPKIVCAGRNMEDIHIYGAEWFW
jgi:hypothetical protein